MAKCDWCRSGNLGSVTGDACSTCGHTLGWPRNLCPCDMCEENREWEHDRTYGIGNNPDYPPHPHPLDPTRPSTEQAWVGISRPINPPRDYD
jgi:hypothetical protein